MHHTFVQFKIRKDCLQIEYLFILSVSIYDNIWQTGADGAHYRDEPCNTHRGLAGHQVFSPEEILNASEEKNEGKMLQICLCHA